MRILIVIGFFLVSASQLGGVEPHEILPQPHLEERAREISKNLRCMVCQNESIDESNAPLAGDIRILVREFVSEGRDDASIYAHLIERYGETILLRPRFNGSNILVYAAGPILLIFGLFCAGVYVANRRKHQSREIEPLSEEEQDRLEQLIFQDGSRSEPKFRIKQDRG